MTDERLRRLEREAATGGDLEARVRLLQEQVRSGAVATDRLELAGYVGDEVALAVGASPPERPGLVPWILGLDRWGREVVVRATLAAARAALVPWMGNSPVHCLEAVEGWLGCPCEEHAQEALEAEGLEAGALMAVTHAAMGGDEGLLIFHEARPADEVEAEMASAQAAAHGWEAAMAAARTVYVPEAVSAAAAGCQAAAQGAGEAAVRAAIRTGVTAWALG